MALVPLKYNFRNLSVRWPTTLLTVLVVAIVVACTCVLFGLVDGLMHSNAVSGDPQTLMVLSERSDNENSSGIESAKVSEIVALPGIAPGPARTPEQEKAGMPNIQDLPLASRELIAIPVMQRADRSRVNLTFRGVGDASPYLRKDFKIVAGSYFHPGRGECIVAQPLSRRFANAAVGDELRVSDQERYRVVGLFTAGGGTAESEVWTGVQDLGANLNRPGTTSIVRLRGASPADTDQIIKRFDSENRFANLKARREPDFYADQNYTMMFLIFLGSLIAVMLTIGALFAAANTMFAAVKSRTREIGTMRALGFGRVAILLSFLFEAIVITALGGVLGAALSLLASNWSFGISDFNTFSERVIQIRMGLLPLMVALVMTLAMGIFGGLFPALRAVRLDVIKSLREL